MKLLSKLFIFITLIFLTGCENQKVIVNDVPEREANEMVVYLSSKDIAATKQPSPTTGGAMGGASTGALWSIAVPEKQEVEAMAVLNRIGLPRKKTVSLLDIFAKSGLISSASEETIRYQAGLGAQIAGTIRKIDGVIDADVELSIPPEEAAIPTPGAVRKRATAAVFVKHQGILDDPNSHLVTKIKRLVSASVPGLDINDVTVISDRSRFTDVTLNQLPEDITPKSKEYVSIWSIVMSKTSAARFRVLFFALIFTMVLFGVFLVWMLWKFYPILRTRGLKNLLDPVPFRNSEEPKEGP